MPLTFTPAELAEAATWAVSQGSGWRIEPLVTETGSTRLDIYRSKGHGEGIGAVPAKDEIVFQVERTEKGIEVLNSRSERVRVVTTLLDALKAGVALFC